MILPVTSGAQLPNRRTLSSLRIKDAHLREVLEGRAFLVFDGAMGTMLQAHGLAAGELPELLCLTDAPAITAIHREYVEAGSQAITTNTFGANARKLDGAIGPDGTPVSVEEIFAAAIACARESGAGYVAADIGPTGALLEPMGTLSFDEAYELFAEQARAAEAHGADLIVIETMTDLLEIKAAVLAAKENSTLPIFATMTFDETGRTFLGTSPTVAATVLGSLGVQALGVNCSLGPEALAPIVADMLAVSPCPVMVQANAGLPQLINGVTTYTVSPEDYVAAVRPMIAGGASILGGCCGTSPAYIRLLAAEIAAAEPAARTTEAACCITSAQQAVMLRGHDIAVIGERINPTGKKKLQAALREGNVDYVLGEAIAQAQAGADLLDVNAGLPEIDEPAMLRELVKRIQGVSGLPLQIDSSDPIAVEAAVRAYAGKPLINSVNGKAESLETILPIAAHYGCAVVGLTLDETGIPPTAEERFAIAERIVAAAESYGIPRHDVLIDCLVMSASTNQTEALEILRAVHLVKERLGVRTVLGVSNISFGLPARPVVNATFLAAAFAAGLDMPILNPLEPRYREVVASWRVLNAQDIGAAAFINDYATWKPGATGATGSPSGTAGAAGAQPAAGGPAATGDATPTTSGAATLFDLVISGNKGAVPTATDAALANADAIAVIDGQLIPALDEVGRRFKAGTFFLPQLMASAEAAKAGFDRIKEHQAASGEGAATEGKGPIALATVKGDIHDIGKNIVKMLLENYGYEVRDLGRDVAPETIVDYVLANNIKIVGLSALMTTTVKSMEETIQLLHDRAPGVKVMVGGAVLTEAYSNMIGADFYAKDAAESTKFAAEILG